MCDSVSDQELLKSQTNVLRKSKLSTESVTLIRGHDFNDGREFDSIMSSLYSTGLQATNLAIAIEEINKMINVREEECPTDHFPYPIGKKKKNCTIFLGYTSNLVTSGIREVIRYLVEWDMVDCIVTTAGGVEEDLIKCLAPSVLGSFESNGANLREMGLNRAGNILIPNDNYCRFEDWLMPILDQLRDEQNLNNISWTPSKIINRLGAEINDDSSICYWAHRNQIPIFCPALTDGSLGDMLYFHHIRNDSNGVKIEIVEDLGHINTLALKSRTTGVIILGGGFVKHHINNANLMRNGSDYTVYINTNQEFDGSDSGAPPNEAVSWGKVKASSNAVKVHAEASLVFPLIVAKTFASAVARKKAVKV